MSTSGARGIILQWYKHRYDINYLEALHHDDLLQILNGYLGDDPNGTMKEYVVETTTHQVLQMVREVRLRCRKSGSDSN